jgi:surfeit locus 1 family protein
VNIIKSLFNRKWIFTTLLALAAMAVLARLGVWQLDRLEQRQVFNARVLAQIEAEPLDLNTGSIPPDLNTMEYRQVSVVGEYDHEHQVALRNQVWQSRSGVHLLTPLKVQGSDDIVLVDRGWIPLEDIEPERWDQYLEPGVVTVSGVIRASQQSPDFGKRVDPTPMPGESLTAWHLADLERMEEQMPYDLLPVYIQQAPDITLSMETMPYRTQPDLELSEGPHLGYAVQWFTFALILGIGYPLYVRREMNYEEN